MFAFESRAAKSSFERFAGVELNPSDLIGTRGPAEMRVFRRVLSQALKRTYAWVLALPVRDRSSGLRKCMIVAS